MTWFLRSDPRIEPRAARPPLYASLMLPPRFIFSAFAFGDNWNVIDRR